MFDFKSPPSIIVIGDTSSETAPSPAQIAAAASGWPTLPGGSVGATLRELKRRRVSLVVVDVWAPMESSVRLIEALRNHWQRVRVLAVTASHLPATEIAVRAAGVDRYLPASDPDTICHAANELAEAQAAEIDSKTQRLNLEPARRHPTLINNVRAGPRGRSPCNALPRRCV